MTKEVTGTTWTVYDSDTLSQAEIYGQVLCDLGDRHPEIVGLSADLANSTKIGNFGKKQTYEEQSERYKYLYSPGELAEIDQKIKEVFDKVKKVFVIMNNHPGGDAVANAFELPHLLKEKIKVKIPSTTLKAYPRLQKFAVN